MKLGVIGIGIANRALIDNCSQAGYTQVFTYDTHATDNTLQSLDQVDVMCVSAGIDLHRCLNPHIKRLVSHPKLMNDIELFAQHTRMPVIAVTGSYGKSTLVMMIGKMLEHLGIDHVIGGNIGIPIWLYADKKCVCILEVSSFQLELLRSLRPVVGVLTNIFPHHLNRHSTYDEYRCLKYKLLSMSANKIDNTLASKSLEVLAADAVCAFMKNDDYHEQLLKCAKVNLEHRQEMVINNETCRIVNDSKATGPEAVQFALNNVQKGGKQLILLCGGLWDDKVNWSCVDLKAVDLLVLFGQAASYLDKIFPSVKKIVCASFHDLKKVWCGQLNNTYVLFSPGCQSFDEFRNFEERGQEFKKLIQNNILKDM